jgi:hypothetical protein
MGNYINPFSIKNNEINEIDKNYFYKIEISRLKNENLIEIEDKILDLNSAELSIYVNKIMSIFEHYCNYNNEIELNKIDYYRFIYNNINFLEIKNLYSIANKKYDGYQKYYEKVCNLDNVKWPFEYI